MKITNLYETPYSGPVYNLEIDLNETYNVESVGVHNCKLVRDKLDIPIYADIHIRCLHVVGSHGIAFKENGELVYVL